MSYLTYNGKMVQSNHKFVIIGGSTPIFDLILTFDNIGSAPVVTPSSVSQWNTWFDLPTQGTPFTSATVLGDVVTLSGGSNITLKDYLFGDEEFAGPGLLSIVDTGCIINTGIGTFSDDNVGWGCYNLTTAVFPALTSIGFTAFLDAISLSSFTIPNGVSDIPYQAFSNTALTTINIPASITNIDGAAFDNCASLNAFNVSISNNNYKDISGVLYNKSQSTIIRYPSAKAGLSYTIPTDVSIIKSRAFENSALNSISMPNTISLMEPNTFMQCTKLSSINLSTSLTSLPANAFNTCVSLGTITIPSSITFIGSGAFAQTGLTNVTLPSSLTTLGSGAFQDSKLSSITLPNSLTYLAGFTFYGCTYLTDISLGNALTNINNWEFNQTGLTKITIPDSVTSIGNGAFFQCPSLGTAIIGNGCASIGDQAFRSCALLTDVSLGNSVKTIGERAFFFTSITNVTIPASVTLIKDEAYASISPFPTLFNLYPLAAPSVNALNTFSSYAKPLHIKSSGTSGYNVSPWTNTAKFSSIIQDL